MGERKKVEMADLDILKELAGCQERNHLHSETRNWEFLSAVTHRHNGTELSQEEFRDNLCLRYGMVVERGS